ncbi:MAG: SU10 major capsid protein [Fluviibacter sp.]
MANLTEPSFSSGKREELADLIALVDAKDTPFTSMAKKGSKPGNTLFRWQADSLPTPKMTGTVDGTDVTTYDNYVKDGATVYRAELSNYIQIFRRSVRVSPLTQDISTVAGVRDELANNVAKGIQALKRDMEVSLCSNNAAQADNGTVPYITRGLHRWLQAAGSGSQDTVLPISSTFQTPTANRSTVGTAALTESVVQNVLTGIYGQTGQYKDYDALVGTALKRAFTNLVFTTAQGTGTAPMTAIRTLNRESDSSSYISSVDVFEGDFGKLRLHPSHYLNATSGVGSTFAGYVIPFDQVEVRYGGNVAGVTSLPNNGGGEARMIEAVAGLCVYNPLAFGVFDFTA